MDPRMCPQKGLPAVNGNNEPLYARPSQSGVICELATRRTEDRCSLVSRDLQRDVLQLIIGNVHLHTQVEPKASSLARAGSGRAFSFSEP